MSGMVGLRLASEHLVLVIRIRSVVCVLLVAFHKTTGTLSSLAAWISRSITYVSVFSLECQLSNPKRLFHFVFVLIT